MRPFVIVDEESSPLSLAAVRARAPARRGDQMGGDIKGHISVSFAPSNLKFSNFGGDPKVTGIGLRRGERVGKLIVRPGVCEEGVS